MQNARSDTLWKILRYAEETEKSALFVIEEIRNIITVYALHKL